MCEGGAGRSAWQEYQRRRPRPGLALLGLAAAAAAGAAGLATLTVAGLDRLLRWVAGVSMPAGLGREAVATAALAGAVIVLARRLVDREADAWRIGAAGEQSTAEALAPLAGEGWRVLHDRRMPGTTANVDHVVIGPGGIWVIETKAWRGRVVVGAGRLRRNGVPADRVYEQVWREARAVTDVARPVLDPAGVAARPVLCFPTATVVIGRDPSGRLLGGPVEVHIPDALLRRLRLAPVALSGAQIDEAARLIDRALPPASGREPSPTSRWPARGP